MVEFLPSREIVLDVFGIEIRWYGVLYVAAFMVAWWMLPKLQRYRGLKITSDEWLQVISWSALSVLVGGRLGYVLFYEPAYFAAHPLEVFSLWQGGMSSHGGFIGVGVALWFLTRQLKIDVLKLADVMIVPVALGLALGRVGNWINLELFLSTTAHLLVVGKNLVIAAVCYLYLRVTPSNSPLVRGRDGIVPPLDKGRLGGVSGGKVLALFLILYGVFRFLTEYLRLQDWPLVLSMTRGQLLTLPIVVVGVLLVLWLRRSESGKA